MSVLAIDTSSRTRTVCVCATPAGDVIDSVVITDRAVSAALPAALAGMLHRVRTAVVVVIGPGSYTGVRAGMAAALGIAHARGLPLHGIGTLDVIAAAMPQNMAGAWAVADAGRGGVYVARCTNSRAGAVSRASVDDFDPGGLPSLCMDPLSIAGLITTDPVEALAASVPHALASAPLDPAHLEAVHVA